MTAQRWWVKLVARWLARVDGVKGQVQMFSLAVTAFSTFSIMLQGFGLGHVVPYVGASGVVVGVVYTYLFTEGGVWNQVARDRADMSTDYSGPTMFMDRSIDAEQRAYLAWVLDPEDRSIEFHKDKIQKLTEGRWREFRDGIDAEHFNDN